MCHGVASRKYGVSSAGNNRGGDRGVQQAMQLEVLYEDNHLLAVAKPAGLATMGVDAETPSLWSAAKEYIKHQYGKPGNVFARLYAAYQQAKQEPST